MAIDQHEPDIAHAGPRGERGARRFDPVRVGRVRERRGVRHGGAQIGVVPSLVAARRQPRRREGRERGGALGARVGDRGELLGERRLGGGLGDHPMQGHAAKSA